MSINTAYSSWVVKYNPDSLTRIRLLCFPHAGGDATSFRLWPDYLPEHIEVCSIRLPGRGVRWREQPFTRISPLINTLADVLAPSLNIPYALFGHSMGALLCFELARELRRRAERLPLQLFLSGRRAPHLPCLSEPIHNLPDNEFLTVLKRYNGIPDPVLESKELLNIYLPILRADLSVNDTYVHYGDSPFDVPIATFGGLDDPLADRQELRAWQEQTYGQFSLHMFAGGHFFLYEKTGKFLNVLAEELVALDESILLRQLREQ